MSGGSRAPQVGEHGVKYGLQAPKAQPKKPQGKLVMFQGSDEEDEAADRNAAVRAQQGVKRSQAKVSWLSRFSVPCRSKMLEHGLLVTALQPPRQLGI
jgi:hypothetical protein